jgi:hypothetical protein
MIMMPHGGPGHLRSSPSMQTSGTPQANRRTPKRNQPLLAPRAQKGRGAYLVTKSQANHNRETPSHSQLCTANASPQPLLQLM